VIAWHRSDDTRSAQGQIDKRREQNMKIFSSKKRVAAIGALTAITLAGGGMAVAYWTTGGGGTGSALAGTAADNLVITASGGLTELYPGGPAEKLALSVKNVENTYSVQLTNQTVTITPGSVMCNTTAVDDTWFTLADATIDSTTIVAAGATATLAPESGVTLQMNNDPDHSQDVCQGANVTFSLTVS
jgi:hypothetical protein